VWAFLAEPWTEKLRQEMEQVLHPPVDIYGLSEAIARRGHE